MVGLEFFLKLLHDDPLRAITLFLGIMAMLIFLRVVKTRGKKNVAKHKGNLHGKWLCLHNYNCIIMKTINNGRNKLYVYQCSKCGKQNKYTI
jgi:hypothetical protein